MKDRKKQTKKQRKRGKTELKKSNYDIEEHTKVERGRRKSLRERIEMMK